MAREVHRRGRRRAGARVAIADVDRRAARARAIADHEAARDVVEVEDRAGALAADGQRVDVEGVDARAETDRVVDVADGRIHQEGGRHDGARGSQDQHRAGAAAGAAVGVRGVADADEAAREAGVEGAEARHVDDGAVGDVGRGVAAELDVDQGRIADAADQERAAAGELEARLGRGAGVEADGDRAVDAEGLADADRDEVVRDRALVAEQEAAEGAAAVRQVEGRHDGGTGDVTEGEETRAVELAGGRGSDRARAGEGDGADAAHDVGRGQHVGVGGAGEDQRARVDDGADAQARRGGVIVADLDRGAAADGGRAGVGVRAGDDDGGRRRQGEADLARAAVDGVLDGGAEGGRTARVGEDGVGRDAAAADELIGRDGAHARGEGGDGLVEAAEVEDAHGAAAAEGQGADGERVVRAEAGRAARDDRAAGIDVGRAEIQDAAAGVADGDLGVGGGLGEGAVEGHRTRAREGQGRGADRAVADGLIGRGARGGEGEERLALAVELKRGRSPDAAEDDGRGAGPGGGAADDEGAVLDAGEAGVGVVAGEGQRTAGGHAADEVAGAVHGVGEGQAARAADDEGAVIDDDGGRRQGADDTGVADLQGGSGSDRGRPLIDVGAREHEGARVDGEAAEAADDGSDRGRAGVVDLERTIDREHAGAADRAAVAEGEDLTGGDVRATVVTKGTRQRHVAAAEDGHRSGTVGIRGAGEAVRTIEGKDAAEDAHVGERTALPDLERTVGDQGDEMRRGTGEAQRTRASLEEVEVAGTAIDDGAAEGVGARGDGDGQAGVADRAVENDGRTDRRVGGKAVQLGIVVVQAEAAGRTRAEGELAEAIEAVGGVLDDRAGAVDDDVAADRVGRAEDEIAAVDDDAARDGLGGGEGERARVEGDAAGEGVADVREGRRAGAVLDDAGRAGDALGAAEGVGERGVVDRQARGRDVAFADDDRAVGGVVIEDDGVAGAVIGGGAARDETEVGRTVAGDRVREMPGRVRRGADGAVPADGITRDDDGELVGVAGDERAGLTAAEAGDRADGEDREVGHRRGEVGQVVRAVGERAAVDRRDGDGTGAAVGGKGADVHDRRRGAEVDVTELERGKIADGRAEDKVGNREAARDAVAGLDRAAIGHVDRAEERAGTAQDGVIGDVGRDVRAGVAAEGQRAAVDVDRDRAGEGAGRSHREGARAGLDELAGTRTVDGAAEGAVRAYGELAVGTEEDRAARGAGAFEGGDGLRGAVEVELGARDVRDTDDGVRREISVRAGLDRAAVEGGLDGIGLGGIEGPHPCPALGERGGVDEAGGQRAVAGAGQDEGAVDAVGALRVERTGEAIEREHTGVGTQGERTTVGRAERHGPGVVAGDVLEDRGRRGDAGVGHAAIDLEGRTSGDDQRGRRAKGGSIRDAERAGRDGRGAGVGVGTREGERAEAVLGDTGRAEGHRAADDDVARAAEGELEVVRRERATEGERAGIAAEAGGRRDGDRAAEGVVAREVLEDAGSGREARAGDGEGFSGGDTARDLDGRAGGDDGRADGGTEGGVVADAQRAFEDLRDARVGRSAGEREDARAILIQGERAEAAVVDRTRVGGARHGVGREHRRTELEAGVGDHAAGAGEGADGGVARAVDVERAAVDRQQAVEARVAAEGVGVADTQRAGVDRRAAGEVVDAGDELDAGAGLDEGELTGELAGVAEVAGVVAAVGGRHVDGQGRGRGGAVGDGRAVARDTGQAGDGLAETVEVEDRGPGRGDVDDRARDAGAGGAGRGEAVVRAEQGRALHREEVVVGTAARVGDRAHAGADHLARSRGDRTGHIERRAVGTEETTGDGGVLDVERAGEGRGAGGGRQEDRGFARAPGSVPDVDRVGDRDAAIQLELGGRVEVDDVRDVAERGARAFDAEVAGTADVHRTGEVVGAVLQDEHARADLGHADIAGDLRTDREIGSRVGIPDLED